MTDLFTTLPVTHSSKQVTTGSVFFAMQGLREDGARYIPEAISRGAGEIVIMHDYPLAVDLEKLCHDQGVIVTRVKDIRRVFAERSAQAHAYPARSLTCIGITGTKGKTTTSSLVYHILHHAGISTALLSTVGNRIGTMPYQTELTTQHADYLQAFLGHCRDERITHVVIEVAAQAVTLQRVHGIPFAGIAWLNFSTEHGEFYASQDAYWHAKALLFNQIIPDGFVVFPAEIERFKAINVPATVQRYYWSAHDTIPSAGSLMAPEVRCFHEGIEYWCPQLLGQHNSANLAAAVAIARALHITPQSIQEALQFFKGVPGRLNWYPLASGAIACIDYAHNPASYHATLSTLRNYTSHLIVVCGAGGDRDPSKRAAMGRIAADYADVLFLTTDNPRSEDPAAICAAMYAGILPSHHQKVSIELDREVAINRACKDAPPGALVALLGKGPDEYQLIRGVRTPFSERHILSNL